MTGVKTGALGPQRQVLDASYYSGVLRSKIKELRDEINNMEKESGALNAENATYLTFERRAETLAQQLKEKQVSYKRLSRVSMNQMQKFPYFLLIFVLNVSPLH